MCNMENNLHPVIGWKDAYGHVETEARKVLAALALGETLTTVELARRLYSGTDEATRKRLFKALDALATHQLAAHVSQGPVVVTGLLKGRHMRLWGHAHEVAPARSCPSCHRPFN